MEYIMGYRLQYNSTPPSKTYSVNADEEFFLKCMSEKLTPIQNKGVRIYRMSDGTLDIYFRTYPIGKVRLQGRKHWMSILKMMSSKTIDGSVHDFIPYIDEWVKYLKKL